MKATAHLTVHPSPSASWCAWIGAVLLLALLCLPRAVAAQELPPAVAIDARGIADADFARLDVVGLQSRLALRLTQAGYAVIALEHRPVIAVFLRVPRVGRRAAEAVDIIVASSRHSRRRRVRRPGSSLAAWHEAVLRAARAAVGEVETAIRAGGAAPGPAPAEPPPLRPSAPADVAGTWRQHRDEVDFNVLALYRPGGTDIAFRIGGRHRFLLPALAARWSLRYSPSHAEVPAGKLDVAEWGLELGLDWRHVFSPRLSVDAGVLGGFLAHRAAFTAGDREAQASTRWDATAVAFAELGWRFSRNLTFVLWAAGGVASREREHRLGGTASNADLLWRRGRYRLEGGGGFRLHL